MSQFEVVSRPAGRHYKQQVDGLFDALVETASNGNAIQLRVPESKTATAFSSVIRNRYVAVLRRRDLYSTFRIRVTVSGDAIIAWMENRASGRRRAA